MAMTKMFLINKLHLAFEYLFFGNVGQFENVCVEFQIYILNRAKLLFLEYEFKLV